MGTDYSIRALLLLAAAQFLAAILAAIMQGGSRKVVVSISSIICIALFGAAVFWTPISNTFGPRFTVSATEIASDFRVWAVLIGIVLVWMTAETILLTWQRNRIGQVMEKSFVPFQEALNKWVMPRRLGAAEIQSIQRYLRNHPPNVAKIRVFKKDNEASQFANDIFEALSEGGWRSEVVDIDDPHFEGLSGFARITTATLAAERDERRPTGQSLLQIAFSQAGVAVDGWGQGGSHGTEADEYQILVGRRRRDSHVSPLRWAPQ